MGKPTKRRSVFPYFKVQVRSNRLLCWVDARKEAFDSLDDAKAFIASELVKQQSRIIVVNANCRRILEQSACDKEG